MWTIAVFCDLHGRLLLRHGVQRQPPRRRSGAPRRCGASWQPQSRSCRRRAVMRRLPGWRLSVCLSCGRLLPNHGDFAENQNTTACHRHSSWHALEARLPHICDRSMSGADAWCVIAGTPEAVDLQTSAAALQRRDAGVLAAVQDAIRAAACGSGIADSANRVAALQLAQVRALTQHGCRFQPNWVQEQLCTSAE